MDRSHGFNRDIFATTVYSIRAANPQDYSSLPSIERAAGMMYLQTRHKDLAFGPNVSDHIEADDRVWVAVYEETIVAFAIVKVFHHVVHLHEIDVHPMHARRGLGRALITHIAHWARNLRHTALTLTTFADVPWNAPYYLRLGFTVVEAPASISHLKTILEAEAHAGFEMAYRIAMQMDL